MGGSVISNPKACDQASDNSVIVSFVDEAGSLQPPAIDNITASAGM